MGDETPYALRLKSVGQMLSSAAFIEARRTKVDVGFCFYVKTGSKSNEKD
jgi:hypothetical protein